jgi:hypothetical protein
VFITTPSDSNAAGGDVLLKAFAERCLGVIMTNQQDRADWVVKPDYARGGVWGAYRLKGMTVYSKDGDLIYSGNTRSLGNAVRDACVAIEGRRRK